MDTVGNQKSLTYREGIMDINRVKIILEDWALYMKVDNHKLGYPSKSILINSGGESSNEVFEQMIDDMDFHNVQAMDAIIDSLEPLQKQAVYARYLKEKKPVEYIRLLSLAMDNIITLASRRIPA